MDRNVLCITNGILLALGLMLTGGPAFAGAGGDADPCGVGVYRDVGGLNKFFLDFNNDGSQDAAFSFGDVGTDVLIGAWGGGADNAGIRDEIPAASNLGKFFLNTDTDPQDEQSFTFGTLDDVPYGGDWNGDGSDNIGIKRNVGGVAKYFLDYGDGGDGEEVFSFNDFADTTVVGDWDAVGGDNIGTVKVVGVGLKWILQNDNLSVDRVNFGTAATDTPVVGDFDNDGSDDLAVVRDVGGGNTKWLIDTDRDGAANFQFNFGATTDTPVVCDWDGLDGDDSGEATTESTRTLWALKPDLVPGTSTINSFRFGDGTGDTPVVGIWTIAAP